MALVSEDLVEQQSIEWFKDLGYTYVCGYDIAPDGETPERHDYRSVILKDRLLSALTRINPDIPKSAINTALAQLVNPNIPALMSANRQVHSWLTKGVKVTFHEGTQEVGRQLKVIDVDNPSNNDWLVVNQFTIHGQKQNRRPDVLVFVNGLPLSVIELKNVADENADIWAAYNQLQTYKTDIPDLFNYNTCMVISDGIFARLGSLSANEERFMNWRTIDGVEVDPLGKHRELETLIKGLFNKDVFLNYLRYFCLFEDDKTVIKKIAGYHQFHAVQAAVESVVKASSWDGNKKGGVVWHTQGAGKSIEMACLAGRLIADPRLENPTLVMVTDRQDLDGQLFGVFAGAGDLLGEAPKQANSRSELRDHLRNRPSGGIIFTTIQKFGLDADEDKFPVLSDRHNVVVIADEAHRTQYGFKAKIDGETGVIKYGLAKSLRDALPNATFLAFTGTPISQDDRDTQAVFGNYVSIYDIQQAVEDGATVPIYYESRLAKINLNQEALPTIDDEVEDILDSETADEREKEKAKSQWSALEAIVGTDARLQEIAEDLIAHYETRSQTQPGKAMIVTMSRDICVRLYDQIIKLKPDWHSDDHMQGAIKVVMTASASDKAYLQPHHTNKAQKKDLEKRFKNPDDPLKLVIVRDMWLTGFDAPCLATMYIDKPMQGANLAQAIARVNRVFKDKPGGLVVDYIGIAPQLKEALATYSAAKGKGRPTIDSSEALRILKEKIQVARDILHPVDWSEFRTKALALIPDCMDHVLGQEDGKRRYADTVLQMTKAFALCGTLDEALELSPEVAFHQAVRAPLIKGDNPDKPPRDVKYELRQLVSQAVVGEGVSDIFKLAGLDSPDISILSEDFLSEVMKMPHKNLAVELLQKLIKDEIKSKFKTNVVKQRKFSDLLQASLGKYANRAIEAAQVIEELIAMAKAFREDLARRDSHNLSDEEEAFYDALAKNESAQQAMGEEVLVEMAREVAKKLRENLTVDWAVRDSVRAKLRIVIRTLLRKYKYPPDQSKDAVKMVLRQAEVISEFEMAY
ncbi:type I restriction endonuclease subunit R [Thalassobacter stenotrophicus]|uniref:Type I restriction enzyme endonuclease subunit n=2 Tax=Thalassobacter stenotrophicus TaxID=266809 RepID=A0A0P1F067_9RHOB|nr:type I restriction endonuclease subunit R [Thalassobacter stenotrophicus]CUH60900.1 Type-1 restriction enzyme R protein [Thalassobacter stenotrophicus]SHI52010.1 type I restriction enzyme, R subunit [Thalassobacter stenotrophicus DSM 16310]